MPIRPFRHPAHSLGTRPRKSFAADADAITERFATTEHQIEVCIWRINDDRAGWLFGTEIHQLLFQVWRQFLWLSSFRLVRGGEGGSDEGRGPPRRGPDSAGRMIGVGVFDCLRGRAMGGRGGGRLARVAVSAILDRALLGRAIETSRWWNRGSSSG